MADLARLQRAARASPERPSIRNISSSSTAYTGSQGLLDGESRYDSPSFDLDRSDYESIQLPSAPVSAVARPALSSRLMSSFSNSQPGPSALTRSKSILHSRAKSLAAFVPKLNSGANNTGSAPSSPERQQPQQQPHRLFGDLFNGESAPMRMGFASSPDREKEESEFIMDYRPTLTSLPSSGRRRSNAPHTPPAQKTGWFGRKTTAPATPTQAPAVAQDELASLNIWTSLFPAGPVEDLTPHAFNDLLLNATTLLERMQTAYKEKISYIASVQPEIEAQREEVEEVETRSRHLKLQLEDMSRRAQEQEQAMRELADQLAEERSKARERRLSTRKVSRPHTQQQQEQTDDEDNDATPRRRNAGKRGSAGSASDSGFESDVSRETSDSFLPAPPPALTLTPSADWKTRHLSAQPSFASSGSTAVSGKGLVLSNETSAWATVEQLRSENRELRAKVESMEGELQGVIDFVGLVGR